MASTPTRRPMETKWVRVTPTIAGKLLEQNTMNRPVSQMFVEQLADDMRNGRWIPNPQVIVIDQERNLVDGQHRLWAVVESGCTIPFQITTGAPANTRDVIDTGRQRTTGHMLAMHGVANPNNVASIARISLMYDQYRNESWGGTPRPTKKQILDNALANKPLMEHATNLAERIRQDKVLRIPNRMSAAAVYLIARDTDHQEMVDDFCLGIGQGIGLERGDPRLALRRVGATGITDWMRGGGATGEQIGISIMLKAWNAWATSRPVQYLRWTTNELPMPTVA